ncbi:abortive infection family protein [Serratia marcescens]|uniref:abortive infection family protein n=1 Tax=Serratia marcescens TaxID=615 RepID=UPI0009532B13|nr:abortive infection family protein [Serratia marcescens]
MDTFLNEFTNDIERARALENIMVSAATGGDKENSQRYLLLRQYFIQSSVLKPLLPAFVRECRDLKQFWGFIKPTEGYQARSNFIKKGFTPLFDYLEDKNTSPADIGISDGLRTFDEAGVHSVWTKALERRHTDPDGAITSARTLLETVCKHILDDLQITYNSKNIEMSELYKLVATELNLSAHQHDELIFRQILGGCSAIVNGLGTLRNKLGDAHGQGKRPIKPAPHHAELAVNLAGSMSIYLVRTWESKK